MSARMLRCRVMRDQAAHRNPRDRIEQRKHCFEHRAGHDAPWIDALLPVVGDVTKHTQRGILMSDATALTASCPPSRFELVQRAPGVRLDGIVSRITGYRELTTGHLRQVETASLIVPLIVSFGGPFAIGLGRTPGAGDRVGSFAAGLFAGPVIIDSFGWANCLQIDFTPLGARRFFHMPMTELTDRMVDLGDALGADGMRFPGTPRQRALLGLSLRARGTVR
jgi:hypothetical protein